MQGELKHGFSIMSKHCVSFCISGSVHCSHRESTVISSYSEVCAPTAQEEPKVMFISLDTFSVSSRLWFTLLFFDYKTLRLCVFFHLWLDLMDIVLRYVHKNIQHSTVFGE